MESRDLKTVSDLKGKWRSADRDMMRQMRYFYTQLNLELFEFEPHIQGYIFKTGMHDS